MGLYVVQTTETYKASGRRIKHLEHELKALKARTKEIIKQKAVMYSSNTVKHVNLNDWARPKKFQIQDPQILC
jgi:hypothetical protein